MECTAQVAALLGRMRRERNGAVADAMRFHGRPYGLNYGVSLPTVRQIARAEGHDAALARLLWMQQVRELQLAALHIAAPEQFTPETAAFWADGIRNSELAEEAAFALLSRAPRFAAVFPGWVTAEDPLLRYAALLGAARSARLTPEWIEPALAAVRMANPAEARLVAQGAVALLEAIGRRNETDRQAVLRAADPLETSPLPAEAWVQEELSWRLAR